MSLIYQLAFDFVKQRFRIQIQKSRKALLWNQVKSRMEAWYSELISVGYPRKVFISVEGAFELRDRYFGVWRSNVTYQSRDGRTEVAQVARAPPYQTEELHLRFIHGCSFLIYYMFLSVSICWIEPWRYGYSKVHSCAKLIFEKCLVFFKTNKTEKPPRSGICVKYFLSIPQKKLSPEKTEKN